MLTEDCLLHRSTPPFPDSRTHIRNARCRAATAFDRTPGSTIAPQPVPRSLAYVYVHTPPLCRRNCSSGAKLNFKDREPPHPSGELLDRLSGNYTRQPGSRRRRAVGDNTQVRGGEGVTGRLEDGLGRWVGWVRREKRRVVEVGGWVGCWMGAARCSIGLGQYSSLHRQRECTSHTLCGDALERQACMLLCK